jgi:hypothetical protein
MTASLSLWGKEGAVSNIVFDDEMGRIQRAIAESHDLVVRRNTVELAA